MLYKSFVESDWQHLMEVRPVRTNCKRPALKFQDLGGREVVGDFDGGTISSEGGALLLREVDGRIHLLSRLAQCFDDRRDRGRIEHTVEELISQRVIALAQGYEDLNDHDRLRHDPLLEAAAGKADPTGVDRKRERDRGKALAGKSTLNRIEHASPEEAKRRRYHTISYRAEAIDRLLVDLFVESQARPPAAIALDLDATDDPIHGNQEGRFFHGYYDGYCYLPLYITCGDDVLVARLRPSNRDGAAGALEELQRVIAQIRTSWPATEILVRGDSGFCREELMAWCETNGVDFLFGLARNPRLEQELRDLMDWVRPRAKARKKPLRRFKDFRYRTRDSWSRERRVVGKAEYLPAGVSPRSNPRFVVTSLSKRRARAAHLYETIYCARGDMENRIKEQQLGLFADRTSSATMVANQLQLYLTTFAYTLVMNLRRKGLAGTRMAEAQVGTLRTTLLKIGALVRVTVRRLWVHLSSACPFAPLFRHALRQLQQAPAGTLRASVP